jgi:hypothetical protein
MEGAAQEVKVPESASRKFIEKIFQKQFPHII